MDIDKSPIANEIKEILLNGVNGTAFDYRAFLYVKKENKTYMAAKVISMDVYRDYVENFTDKRIITLSFTAGIYSYHIFPNADDLELTLVRQPVFQSSGGPDFTRETYIEEFKVVPVSNKNPTIKRDRQPVSQEILDLSKMVEVEFDLITKTADFVKTTVGGGIIRKSTTEAAIKTILTNNACQGPGDSDLVIRGVDMVPANNNEVREHIIIPHGVPLYDIPQFIQKKCGGVYSSGLGCFLQNRYWYIYPAYDYTRINDTNRTITFCVLPVDKLPRIERTFRFNGKQVIAIATGDVRMNNAVDRNKRNFGNGVSFTKSSAILHDMVKQGGNQAIINRAATNNEVSISERPDGLNYVPVSNAPITDNKMEEFSKLAKRNAGTVILTWENSEPDSIIPGMMAKIYYIDNDKVKETVGVVGGAQHYTYMFKKGFTNDRYLNATAVTIHVDPNKL